MMLNLYNMGWIWIQTWIRIRNSENSRLDPDPEKIIPDPQHWFFAILASVHDPIVKSVDKSYNGPSLIPACLADVEI